MAQRHTKRSRRRLRNRLLKWCAAILVIGGLIWFDWAAEHKRTAAIRYQQDPYAALARGAGSASRLSPQPLNALSDEESRFRTVVYPYSVIPGGARDVAELRVALARDPVAAAHYASFDLARAHVVRLEREQYAHVSYRMGDHIFWTSRTLKLREGESVITDGEHTARTRCGNLVAEIAPGPPAPEEPAPELFDTPLPVDLEPAPLLQLEAPPADEPPIVPLVVLEEEPPVDVIDFLPPIVIGVGTPQPPPTPPGAITPEPDALILFASGVLVLLGLARWRRHRRDRAL